ncbi:MAG TPA: cytochrome c oxidase subunit II [Thermodesulfobacteriota bacterium]
MFNWMEWLPKNVSTYGGDVDSIFAIIYWGTLAWLVASLAVFGAFLVLYRRGRGRRAAYVRGERFREMAWILVPCVVVLALDLWVDWRGAPAWAKVKGQMPPADLTIQVTGRQFYWDVLYPGPDGAFGTADDRRFSNEIHVPTGRIVRLLLRSEDVIHSFFAPNLRFKQDAVPGRLTGGWFEATTPGVYELPCAELCGVAHSIMNGRLHVHTPDDYEAWARQQWPAAATARSESLR